MAGYEQQLQISREELKKLYFSMENKELCKMLNCTNQTLVSLLKSLNIERKGKGNRNSKRKKWIIVS
jgi:hypothetical protein